MSLTFAGAGAPVGSWLGAASRRFEPRWSRSSLRLRLRSGWRTGRPGEGAWGAWCEVRSDVTHVCM